MLRGWSGGASYGAVEGGDERRVGRDDGYGVSGGVGVGNRCSGDAASEALAAAAIAYAVTAVAVRAAAVMAEAAMTRRWRRWLGAGACGWVGSGRACGGACG